jgi:protein-S-isoprenylcysteine O-methyltransferase Ste14
VQFFNLGLALLFRSRLALLQVGLLAGVLLWRIQAEEALMGHPFGAECERYSQSTWRLIPRIC